jgi:hypothetical protein
MDRESAGKVVVAFYNAWNERIPRGSDWDELLDTWSRFLADVEVDEARYAYRRLVAQDANWLPRPGTVRRLAISSRPGQPPREWEAWAQLRRVAEASHTGVGSSESLHEVVSATLVSLGGRGALELHTNGDRELFFRAYRDRLADWETERYGVPSSKGD